MLQSHWPCVVCSRTRSTWFYEHTSSWWCTHRTILAIHASNDREKILLVLWIYCLLALLREVRKVKASCRASDSWTVFDTAVGLPRLIFLLPSYHLLLIKKAHFSLTLMTKGVSCYPFLTLWVNLLCLHVSFNINHCINMLISWHTLIWLTCLKKPSKATNFMSLWYFEETKNPLKPPYAFPSSFVPSQFNIYYINMM